MRQTSSFIQTLAEDNILWRTIFLRKTPHIYVANWFYLGFIVTIALLHVVNNLAIPVSGLASHSYSLFAGVQF